MSAIVVSRGSGDEDGRAEQQIKVGQLRDSAEPEDIDLPERSWERGRSPGGVGDAMGCE